MSASLFMLSDTDEEKIRILEKEFINLRINQETELHQEITSLRSIIAQITECDCQCDSCSNYE